MLLIFELLFVVLLSMILLMIYRHERLNSGHTAPKAVIEEYWSGKERRLHYRFEKDLNVSYVIEKKQHLKGGAKTVDISEGGMKMLMDDKLAKGTILDLKIELSGSKKYTEVEGEVVWCEEAQDLDASGKRLFHSGIRFLAIKDPAGAKLSDYVRSLASGLGRP